MLQFNTAFYVYTMQIAQIQNFGTRLEMTEIRSLIWVIFLFSCTLPGGYLEYIDLTWKDKYNNVFRMCDFERVY
jgi:hypothetical protein